MSIAIVTGASSGIGAELARGLVSREIDEIWLVARREERLVSLGEELGIKYKCIPADLATNDGVESIRTALEAEKPSVKYLINAAGFGDFGAFDELPESEIAKMIDLNVKALVLITHMCVPYMERGGRIVQMGSGSCFTPLPYFNVYSSGKVFVLHYTKSLNYELKKYGVRATCFCPGWVETEFLGKAGAYKTTRPKVSKMKPLLDCKKVVAGCLRAMDKGRTMYVTNWYTKLQHLLFKIVPDPILTRLWLGMLERAEEKK
ncbi:MAG: SDR family NAD(P)-dependent oxidoreductase [Clostridia bacterium]|nr:SDR family NAD(P)-dependent oxidoreductase [Clostridia bacterium]